MGSISEGFTPEQQEIWRQAKKQALVRCKILNMGEEPMLHCLARYLLATKFEISPAIQKLLDYNFWMKSINPKEDIERLYPINQEHQTANVREKTEIG